MVNGQADFGGSEGMMIPEKEFARMEVYLNKSFLVMYSLSGFSGLR
jgi:hypothetical protein